MRNASPEKLRELHYINAINFGANGNSINFIEIVNSADQGHVYLIDFSEKHNIPNSDATKNKLRNAIGVDFSSDFVLIGGHKGSPIFTPLNSGDDQIFLSALNRDKESNQNRQRRASLSNRQPHLPHIAFYIDVNRRITDAECKYMRSVYTTERGKRSFCENAGISLIYRVDLMRSLARGSSGSSTPDAKLVRVSLDSESSGAGIHLNSRLIHEMIDSRSSSTGRNQALGPIAKDYRFSVTALNQTPSILRTFPSTNINFNYERQDVSGFNIGIAGGGNVDYAGPKAQLEGRFDYFQARSLIYNTKDYEVIKSSNGPHNVSFTWKLKEFENNGTPLTAGGSESSYENKVHAISYSSFVPNFDIMFKAPPDSRGKTTFSIDSSVNMWISYLKEYRQNFGVGAMVGLPMRLDHQEYKRFNKEIKFTVDWDHPVFLGGRPVNLQSGGDNNKCIEYSKPSTAIMSECSPEKIEQGFIFDSLNRYVSTANPEMCLDGEPPVSFKPCNFHQSQRWEWGGNSDMLRNEYMGAPLAYDQNAGITLSHGSGGYLNSRTITRFVDLFSNYSWQ